MAYYFNEKGARRIVNVVRHVESTLPGLTKPGSTAQQPQTRSLWAQIGSYSDGSYSWQAIQWNEDGTSEVNTAYGTSAKLGVARECNDNRKVANGAIVELKKIPGWPYWVFNTSQYFDRVKGLATAAFDDTDSSISIDAVVPTRGASPLTDPDSTTETLTVYNTLDYSGDNNAVVWAAYDYDAQQWEIIDCPCPA